MLSVDLLLLLAESTQDSNPPAARKAAAALAARLKDYDSPLPGSAQRRFALRELRRLFPDLAPAAALAAEDLAAEYLERATNRTPTAGLQPAGIDDVWKVASPAGRIEALFRTSTLTAYLQRKLDDAGMPAGVRLTPVSPQRAGAENDEFLSAAVGADLPQWRVSLAFDDDPFADAAAQRSRFYFWTALVTIVGTGALALLTAAALRRQMQLARLKNDLTATVSHELKTPLSAIRLLVDTLLEQERPDARQTHEYLRLISRENERLCRLIDQFLTFSRLAGGKRQFASETIEPAKVVRRAIEALQERFSEPNCRFESRIEPDLPAIGGDFDALVTVLVNLLDNAWKYTGEQKQITLRAYARGNQVCFAVADDGLGLSARDQRRIFDRFFQVDRQLTRTAGGCGLGLSIVRNIVAAHGGAIDVESDLGKGSTFTVRIPVKSSPAAAESPGDPAGEESPAVERLAAASAARESSAGR